MVVLAACVGSREPAVICTFESLALSAQTEETAEGDAMQRVYAVGQNVPQLLRAEETRVLHRVDSGSGEFADYPILGSESNARRRRRRRAH